MITTILIMISTLLVIAYLSLIFYPEEIKWRWVVIEAAITFKRMAMRNKDPETKERLNQLAKIMFLSIFKKTEFDEEEDEDD